MFFLAVAEFSKIGLVQDLAAVMLMAGFAAALFHYMGWPKVIGYIAAGALMGLSPSVKNFLISNGDSVDVLANLGVIFLMFTLGLELNVRKLQRSGGTIFPTAIFDLMMMLTAGYAVGVHCLGLGLLPSLFLGAMVCDSSTTLLAKSLEEMGCSRENFASLIFGTTICEDILSIGVMAVLTGLSLTGQFQAGELLEKLGALALFLIAVLVFGFILLPRFLDRLSRLKDKETLLVIILGVCFGIAFIAEKLEYSLALGAFLVGAMVAKSSVSRRVHDSTGALRSMFSAVFFVTVGLMVRPMDMLANWMPILGLTLLVLLCKTFNCAVMSYLTGQPHKDALKIGIGLAQIGDFSYMIALLGMTLNKGADPYPRLYQIAVGTSVLTTLLNPFLLRSSVAMGDALDRRLPAKVLRIMQDYTAWMRSAGKNMKKDSSWSKIRNNFVFFAVDLALMAAVFFSMHCLIYSTAFWEMFPDALVRYRRFIVWLLTSAISFFLIVSAFLNARNVGKYLGRAILPKLPNPAANHSLESLFRLLVVLIAVFVMLVEFTYFSTMLMMGPAVILCIVLGYALLCLVFWKKVKAMALEGQNTLQLVLEREEATDEAPEIKANENMYRSVTIPQNSGAAKLTLAQLHLRHRTGATIVKIDRPGQGELPNPDANTRLAAGDRLSLVATEEQFTKTVELLSSARIEAGSMEALAGFLELRIENVRLKQGDFAPGKTLKELRLRNVSGTTVVRIQRNEGAMEDNPGPNVQLFEGDWVYVLGTSAQIAAARAYLEGGA